MTPEPTSIDQDWPELARAVRDASLAQCVGVFDSHGEPEYLNEGMKALLGGQRPEHPRSAYLMNPSLEVLQAPDAGDGLVFDGLLTTGDGLADVRTVKARCWNRDRRLLIVGEFDVLELERLNTALSRTNQEISNLQRELVKKNHLLESTLHRLEETQAQLVESQKMASLGVLVAGVAHEINTPAGVGLISVSSLIDRLQEFEGRAEDEAIPAQAVTKYLVDSRIGLELIEANLQRIAGLVSEFKQVAAVGYDSRPAKVTIKPFLDSIIGSLGERLRTGEVGVHVDCDEQFEAFVDRDDLSKVITNLLINSMDHGFKDRKSGEIWISVLNQADEWTINYRDDGLGLAGDTRDRIFDPFFTTDRTAHFGLGLHILYNLVTHKMNGSVRVEDTSPSGFSMTLRFPLEFDGIPAVAEAGLTT